jgi:putative YjhG/YagF family dehydratase
MQRPTLDNLVGGTPELFDIISKAPGPQGELPLTEDLLLNSPSGDLFGWTQNVGMGWDPDELTRTQVLILSTQGGIRENDGTAVALGYHTGHWEVGLQMRAAAETLRANNAMPFAGYVTDPCDGRTQGTEGMFDSLPYRNDAAIVFRRLIRSLPTRQAVIGVATCDKGLPAMLIALAGTPNLATILVPGGVTLPPTDGEDAGKVQTIGARFAQGELSLSEAAALGCRACGSPGGGCQFLGTAATSQVVAEALGIALPHSALAPSGQPIWLELANASARAVLSLRQQKITTKDIITPGAIHNAMVVHAAFGGSTNLLLHIPAIAHAAKLTRPTVQDWERINRQVPRLVDVLPNGPRNHVTVMAYMPGGVPEVLLHLRDLVLLDTSVRTVTGETIDTVLDWWAQSERRQIVRRMLSERDGVNADDVIMAPAQANARGLTATVTFPQGNLAPEGSVIKSTAIDPAVVDADGVYRKIGPAKVFIRERDAVRAIKGQGDRTVQAGDIIVLVCGGPLGTGMEETYQVTSALKHIRWGRDVAVITDARFSGVSTGACIGHVGPEALAGGPIGKVLDGDMIEIIIDRVNLVGSVNLVGANGEVHDAAYGSTILAQRELRDDLASHPLLPDDTKLWAALQQASGGTWGGCVYDVESIVSRLK